MKKIIALFVGVCLFAGMIAGATVIYNRYLEENKPSNIVVLKGNEDADDSALPPFLQQRMNAATAQLESQNTETVAASDTRNEPTDTDPLTWQTESVEKIKETETKPLASDTEHSHGTFESATEKNSAKSESFAETEGSLESTLESELESLTEEVVEISTEIITEEITEKQTEKQTEKVTEAETEKVTEAETEKVTEKVTETETEEVTEAETETECVSPYLAPDFTFYTLEGKAVKLSDFRGKPIVLNFWSSGCYYCAEEMPYFEEAYKKYGDEVVFLMVDCIGFFGETVKTGSEFIGDKGYTFPVYYDTQNNAVGVYIAGSLPYTFFIDRDFDLYTYIPGMADSASLETCIGWILE